MKFLSALIIFLSMAASPDPTPDLLGVWWNTERDAKVEIYRCGKQICGKIVWIEIQAKEGTVVLDDNNSNASLQKRPLLGADVLEGFVFNGKDRWVDGEAYDPKSGKSYTSYLKLKNKNTLEIRGYIGTPLLGRTVEWRKASN
jgi:uncharacterized protein (DUF2147 family)